MTTHRCCGSPRPEPAIFDENGGGSASRRPLRLRFLWYFEPRFKLRYGTYLSLPAGRRIVFHLAGSVGTPVTLLVGFFVLADQPILAWLNLAGCVVTTAMQLGAFIAAWVGVTRKGPFLLTSLTTPATVAKKLKAVLRQP